MSSLTRTAGTGANDTSIGSVAWSNPGRITADDSSFSEASSLGTNISNYLKATNFGFGIPSDSRIDGIIVKLGDRASLTENSTDHAIRIVKNGNIGSTNRADGGTWSTSGLADATFGSSSDLWGEEWSAADINSSDFGVVVSAQGDASGASPFLDYIQITVHYTVNPLGSAAFFSGWDIDKIIDFQNPDTNPDLSITLGSSASTTVTVPHSYGFRPYVIAQYKPSPQSAWYEAGVNTQVSSEQSVEMHVWVRSNDIRLRMFNGHASSVNIDIRYWVLSDGN